MALDRTWYNTLVDDDGSGTTGTPWNKAAVLALLTAIDARVTDWTNVPFDPTNFVGSAPLVWTVEAGDVLINRHCRLGNVLVWTCNLAPTTTSGGASSLLTIKAPPGITFASTQSMAILTPIGQNNAIVAPIYGLLMGLTAPGGGNWPLVVNGLYTYFTWIGEVL